MSLNKHHYRSVLLWLAVGLALLWSAVAWEYRKSESLAMEHARQESAAWAMTFASQAQSIFVYSDQALHMLRQTWVNHPKEMNAAVHLHKDLEGGFIMQVAVIDAKGYLVYSDLGMPTEPSFLGDREHFTVHQALMQDQLFVSRPVKGRVSGKWAIQLTRPIFVKDLFAGVIVISVDPDYFVRFYQATGFGQNGAARMIRDTGEVMARSSEQDKYVGTVIQTSPYGDPGAPLRGDFRRKAQVDGVDRLSSYHRLPQYGLTLVVGSSVDDILAPVHSQLNKMLMMGALVSVLLILLTCLLLRAIVRQKQAMHAVAQSDERFRMIFDMLPIGISLSDQQGRVVDCNAAAQRMLGFTKAQLLAGDADLQVLRPDGTAMPSTEWATQQALAKQVAVMDVPMEVRSPGGSSVWVSASATPVNHPSYGVVGAFVDVTDRVRAETDMRRVMQAAGELIWLSDSQGRLMFANDATCEVLGYSPQDMRTMRVMDLLPQEDISQLMDTVKLLDTQPFVRREWWLKRKEWGTVLVELVNQRLGEDRYLSIGHEIGERKRAEHKLQLAASVFTHAREGIMITDARGTIVDVNDTFTRITGYSREEAMGQNPRILNSGRQPAEYYATMWRALQETGQWTGEVWNRRKSGEVFAEMQTVSAVRDAAGVTQNYVALFSDITPMKTQQQQLEHIAHYDALTRLPNRVLLADRLQQAIRQTQRHQRSLAVVFLDLDGFKAVNDIHGHAVGDTLLIALAIRMQGALREGDTLARIGGDEFIAILVDLALPRDCEPVLNRLLVAASSVVEAGALQLQVSASMGVSICPHDSSDADLLIRQADQAMYAAKDSGKNRYHLFEADHDSHWSKAL